MFTRKAPVNSCGEAGQMEVIDVTRIVKKFRDNILGNGQVNTSSMIRRCRFGRNYGI